MAKMCSVIALFGGTDFSRGMPKIGPKRAWEFLQHTAFRHLQHCFDTSTKQLNVDETVENLIARAYGAVFPKHTAGAHGFAGTMRKLLSSKLSDKTKDTLPSLLFSEVSVLNANWIVSYWSGTTLDEERCGYKYVNRRLVYADT
jgi:hypothetical protein